MDDSAARHVTAHVEIDSYNRHLLLIGLTLLHEEDITEYEEVVLL